MKTKIILTLVLITSLIYDASANFRIIMKGGGKNRLFDYVYVDDHTCVCKGVGSLVCPVNFSVQGIAMTTWVSGKEITEYVFSQVSKGNTSGETTFGEDLPVKWSSPDKETIEIDIDNTNIKDVENAKK